MLYTKPERYDCIECGGIASYPDPHNPTCIYRGAGQLAMSPMVSTMRLELEIAEQLWLSGAPLGEDWKNLCFALLKNMAALLTGIDQTSMGRVPA